MGKKPDQMPSPSHTGATAFPCSTSPGSGRSPGEGNGNPLQYPCLENPKDGGAWQATAHGVTKSLTRLSNFTFTLSLLGFPGDSAGKESACNAGDPGSIPGSGRSPATGIGYPLQYSWASLVAQLVKNLPANAGDMGLIPELEGSPGAGNGNPLQFLAWKIPW